jgi:hypothetical protein
VVFVALDDLFLSRSNENNHIIGAISAHPRFWIVRVPVFTIFCILKKVTIMAITRMILNKMSRAPQYMRISYTRDGYMNGDNKVKIYVSIDFT